MASSTDNVLSLFNYCTAHAEVYFY